MVNNGLRTGAPRVFLLHRFRDAAFSAASCFAISSASGDADIGDESDEYRLSLHRLPVHAEMTSDTTHNAALERHGLDPLSRSQNCHAERFEPSDRL